MTTPPSPTPPGRRPLPPSRPRPDASFQGLLLRVIVAAVAAALLVVGLAVARDVEFQIFVFEDLSIGAIAGSWLGFWRWTLGGLNGLMCGLLFRRLDRSGRLSLPTNLLLAWTAGTLGTALATVVLLTALLVLWFLVGAVFMLFAGPF